MGTAPEGALVLLHLVSVLPAGRWGQAGPCGYLHPGSWHAAVLATLQRKRSQTFGGGGHTVGAFQFIRVAVMLSPPGGASQLPPAIPRCPGRPLWGASSRRSRSAHLPRSPLRGWPGALRPTATVGGAKARAFPSPQRASSWLCHGPGRTACFAERGWDTGKEAGSGLPLTVTAVDTLGLASPWALRGASPSAACPGRLQRPCTGRGAGELTLGRGPAEQAPPGGPGSGCRCVGGGTAGRGGRWACRPLLPTPLHIRLGSITRRPSGNSLLHLLSCTGRASPLPARPLPASLPPPRVWFPSAASRAVAPESLHSGSRVA